MAVVGWASVIRTELKEKPCSHCGSRFRPWSSTQTVCSPICASKKVRADKKRERQEIRERKAAIKTIPDLIRETQTAFNAFIRERDHGKPCICCGRPLGTDSVGGGYDCGHYRSVGSAPHLRFDERNAHAQRKDCNRYGAGRAVDYRIGLVARLGLEVVGALESDNQVHKWTRDELIELKATYRRKLRELKARTE